MDKISKLMGDNIIHAIKMVLLGYENVPIDSILREFVGGGCFKV